MSIKEIKKYIALLKEEDLASLHFKNKEFEITLHAKDNIKTLNTNQEIKQTHDTNEDKLISINAPLVGTFYSKPTPEDKPFISVGQQVNMGEVVCILESMKVMNEIKADKSGIIKEVLVKDGDAVSYDQPLFKLV